MAELRRLMVRHRLASEQLREIEAERDRVLTVARPDREERMIRLLVQIVGLGMETATVLVREMLCRPFRDRRALAGYAGLTGTPFRTARLAPEQGLHRRPIGSASCRAGCVRPGKARVAPVHTKKK